MMMATLSGYWKQQQRQLAVEVSADLETWFHEIRRGLGATNEEMIGYIMAGQPSGAQLTPELVEAFLSRMEKGRDSRETSQSQATV